MNGKINFLNLFFQSKKELLPLWLAKRIIDCIPSLIFIYDTDTRCIQYGNKKLTEFVGRDVGNLTLETALKHLFHRDDAVRVTALLNPMFARVEGRPGECTLRLSDHLGVFHFFDVNGHVLLKNDDGASRLILFFAHDITDVLKSKEEIETTRELLDETEELLQFGSWAWEVSTHTVTWTSGLYALLEYSRQEVAGKIGYDFYLSHVLEEYRQSFDDTIQNALREKSDFNFEYVVKTRSAALKNISTKGKIVMDETGEVVKILCINRDITALRTFEKEQERSIRELNRSNRDLEEFAYIASHDLQEPLRKISMFTERLKAKFNKGLDQEGELFIDRILNSAANMRTLIDNLLDFSRANRRSGTLDEVSIRSVLDVVIAELELKIEETKSNIIVSGTFPTIEAVTSEMVQLFNNVLSNAIKFRRASEVAEINVQAGKLPKTEKQVLGLPISQNFYKIEVKDNGIGFESEYSDKIFQIFQRLNGKAEYPGSGIGLAICKKIVEKHNGLIFANSLPDQGATFTIILPEKQF